MLLIRRRNATGMLAAFALAVAAPLLLPACSVRYDDAYDRRSRRQPREAETAQADGPRAKDSPREVADAEAPVVFGIRRDNSLEMKRAAKIEHHKPRDPRTTPSYGDLRAAQATRMLEDQIFERGGQTHIRYDGSSSNPAGISFPAIPGALGLRVTASSRLNSVDGVPTAAVLIVYHLKDRLALDQLARTEDGMLKLLEGEFFDNSVVAVRRLDIQPGTQADLEMARGEGGRHVAIVAGYNRPDSRTSLFVTSYHIGSYKKKADFYFERDIDMYVPLPLNLHVNLGEASMLVTETGGIYHNLRDSTQMQRRKNHQYQRINWDVKKRLKATW